jgi:hypothetical protein
VASLLNVVAARPSSLRHLVRRSRGDRLARGVESKHLSSATNHSFTSTSAHIFLILTDRELFWRRGAAGEELRSTGITPHNRQEMQEDTIRLFVSYTHDSEEHKRRVRELADRLRTDGVDCDLDQYIHQSPPEGWPKWMMRQVAGARFVLVVCTERYCQRVTTDDAAGGQGSRWEGALITQELYDSGGANSKFIPIVFDPADSQFRPPFLRGATFYDLASVEGYDRLFRHITDQPSVVKPPLGKMRQLADSPPQTPPAVAPAQLPAAEPSAAGRRLESLVLLFPLEVGMQSVTFEAVRIEVGEKVTVEVVAGDPATTAIFTKLAQNTSTKYGLSFRHSPLLVRLLSAKQVVEHGEERWVLTFNSTREHLQGGVMGEMSFSNHSADDIAEMRARRILLNEQHARGISGNVAMMNDSMLEVLVRGLNAPVESKNSRFPEIYHRIGSDPDYFVAVAKLFGQLMLYLSGTVDRIIRLDLDLVSHGRLAVNFEGQRPRRYTNVDPPVIRVTGECDLLHDVDTQT